MTDAEAPLIDPPVSALYLCLRCGKRWRGKAGPTSCISCGHLYVKWLDFDEKIAYVVRRRKPGREESDVARGLGRTLRRVDLA